MPIQPYEGSAVRIDGDSIWHITTVMDTDAQPHPVVVTWCARRLSIIGVEFEELRGKIGVCGECAKAMKGLGTAN